MQERKFHQPALFSTDSTPQDLRLAAGFPAARRAEVEPCERNRLSPRRSLASMVAEFHRAFELPTRDEPTADIDEHEVELRCRLLADEVAELADACRDRSLLGIADELADVVYVAYGTALTFGIDLDRVVAEVHRANMSKLDDQGHPVMREDGKVLKGRHYRPPDIASTLWGPLSPPNV